MMIRCQLWHHAKESRKGLRRLASDACGLVYDAIASGASLMADLFPIDMDNIKESVE